MKISNLFLKQRNVVCSRRLASRLNTIVPGSTSANTRQFLKIVSAEKYPCSEGERDSSAKSKGFTLIELMVVIAIIAVLTGIIVSSLVGSKAKSRDARRASDLSQIQLAIEQFFDRCDQYPATLTTTAGGSGICPNDASGNPITLGTFISKIPTDPTNTGVYMYSYAITGTPPSNYVMHTTFESVNSASSISSPAPSGFSTGWTFATGPSFSTCDTSLNFCVRPN